MDEGNQGAFVQRGKIIGKCSVGVDLLVYDVVSKKDICLLSTEETKKVMQTIMATVKNDRDTALQAIVQIKKAQRKLVADIQNKTTTKQTKPKQEEQLQLQRELYYVLFNTMLIIYEICEENVSVITGGIEQIGEIGKDIIRYKNKYRSQENVVDLVGSVMVSSILKLVEVSQGDSKAAGEIAKKTIIDIIGECQGLDKGLQVSILEKAIEEIQFSIKEWVNRQTKVNDVYTELLNRFTSIKQELMGKPNQLIDQKPAQKQKSQEPLVEEQVENEKTKQKRLEIKELINELFVKRGNQAAWVSSVCVVLGKGGIMLKINNLCSALENYERLTIETIEDIMEKKGQLLESVNTREGLCNVLYNTVYIIYKICKLSVDIKFGIEQIGKIGKDIIDIYKKTHDEYLGSNNVRDLVGWMVFNILELVWAREVWARDAPEVAKIAKETIIDILINECKDLDKGLRVLIFNGAIEALGKEKNYIANKHRTTCNSAHQKNIQMFAK